MIHIVDREDCFSSSTLDKKKWSFSLRTTELVSWERLYARCKTLQERRDESMLEFFDGNLGSIDTNPLSEEYQSHLDMEYGELEVYLKQKELEKQRGNAIVKAKMKLIAAQKSRDVRRIMEVFCENPILLDSLSDEEIRTRKELMEQIVTMPGKTIHDDVYKRYLTILMIHSRGQYVRAGG